MPRAVECFPIIRMAPYTSRNPSQKRKKGRPARPSPSSPNPTSKFQILFRADFPAKALARRGTEPAALTEPTDRSRRTEPTDLNSHTVRASLKVSNHIAARHVNISHPVRSGSCPRPRSRNRITPHETAPRRNKQTGADPIHHIVIHPSIIVGPTTRRARSRPRSSCKSTRKQKMQKWQSGQGRRRHRRQDILLYRVSGEAQGS
jgi:hypothetical protein